MKLFFSLLFISIFSLMALPQTIKTAYINGKIYTVDPSLSIVQCVITENNKIVFTGSNADAKSLIDNNTQIIDLKGKLMLPGFIDAHTHFFNGGFYLTGIDLRPARSEAEFREILQNYMKSRKGKWITGGYWDHELWVSKKMPAKELIDDFTSDTPVFVDRIDGHVAVANSLALKLAGITKDTKDPDGGKIEKDPVTGEPTGILKDNAMDLIENILPVKSREDYMEAGRASLEHLKELGVTGINDISSTEEYDYLKEFETSLTLTCRIFSRLPIKDYKKLLDKEISSSDNSLLRNGSLKIYADGSLGASTAWFFEPYSSDTSVTGLPSDVVLNGDFEKWAFDADKNKLQLCTHAIGDRANYFTLQLYKKIKETNPGWDRRFRIEHAQHVRFEDMHLFKENYVIASVQPYHAIDDGVWAENRIGIERIKYTHPYKSFLENDIKVCFGTDWPIAPLNPLLGIYAAVTRRTVDGKNPDGWIPEQKISVEDAVKCYTINSAYAGFSESLTGSIEPGKKADLIVLSDDIFNIDVVKIKDVRVEMTIFDGKIIFER